jgi:NSS family neurotransmitter:Na+ symporter
VGTFLIFVLATIQIIMFGWVMGVEKGFAEAHRGAAIAIPPFFKPVMKYLCPLFLLTIFAMWLFINVFGYSLETGKSDVSSYVRDLAVEPNAVAIMSVTLILLLGAFIALIVHRAKVYKST